MQNLFADLPPALQEEQVRTLAGGRGCRIERIVSQGQASPEGFWYDQPQHEWVVLLSGSARLRFADPEALDELHPGDWRLIRAHQRHRVEWTAPDEETIWLAVFFEADDAA